MNRICVIARADLTGLGVQSRNWVRLLNPDKIIVINSAPFNGNEQHFEWYTSPHTYIVDGFIGNDVINAILDNIDVLLTFEIPYNYELIRVARNRGIKTIIQNNWEFTDYLRDPSLPLPDILMNHSYWHLEEQRHLWTQQTEYCATPVFLEDYEDIYKENLDREGEKRRFLHIAGRKTYEDRNGTQDLLKALALIPAEYDFEIVIKAQNADVGPTTDPRIIVDRSSPVDEKELYRNFDAMIMPRRYGGACLPMNESLASGLPVIMTDIDPNNKILYESWLVKANKVGEFYTRVNLDIFSADPNALADKICEFITRSDKNMTAQKLLARDIAVKEYSAEAVKEKWTGLLAKLGL